MKKHYFLRLFSFMLIICLFFTLVGCEFKFPSYSFTNPIETFTDWRDLSYNDDDIVVDGDLDETVWQNTLSFSFFDDTNTVKMTTKVYLSDEGAFFGLYCTDPWIYYNPSRSIFNNTSMELYISSTNSGSLNENTVQLRIDAIGGTESWIGVETPGIGGNYGWTIAVVKFMTRVKIDGELNTSNCKGYTAELFMPYGEIGLSEKPNSLYVFPAFNRVTSDVGENDRLGWYSPGGSIYSLATYYKFDENGYVGGDVDGVPVGDYGGYYKTAGWELNNENNIVSATTIAGGDQIAYFKDVNTNKYYVSVRARYKDAYNNDQWPKMGLLVAQNDAGMAISMVDVRATWAKDWFAVRRGKNDDNWNWPNISDGITRYNASINRATSIKLSVIRDNTWFYYFVNDQFMYKVENAMFGNNPTVAGLITFQCQVEFYQFETNTNATEIDTMINEIEGENANWKWFGDFTVNGDNEVILKEGNANVGIGGNSENGERNIFRKDVKLSGNFTLRFKISDFIVAKTLPNWPMTPFFTTHLRREDGKDDLFMLYPGIHGTDNNLGEKEPSGSIKIKLQGTSSMQPSTGITYDQLTDSEALFELSISRTINDGQSTFTVIFNGEQVGNSFVTDYTGDYSFGFSANFAACKISDIVI